MSQKHIILFWPKQLFVILFLLSNNLCFSSGGYDNGTPAGKGNLDLELTLNPFDIIKYGQSYVVWGYGLTDKIDFHGYLTHPASGINQLYSGFLYNFMSNKYLDLSTAIGLRFRRKTVHPFLPQLLYTIKLPKKFDVIGSVVAVSYTNDKFNTITTRNFPDKYKTGLSFDIALRIPIPLKKLPCFTRGIKFAIGAFHGAGRKWTHWYPTYSVDLRLNLCRSSADAST